MANTYTLIAGNVLGSTTASVTFSSIPSTYTDLQIILNLRGSTVDVADSLTLRFNGDSSAIYSYTGLKGEGTAISQFTPSNQTEIFANSTVSSAGDIANRFNPFDIYLPNYTSSTNKPLSQNTVREASTTSGNQILLQAGLYRNSSAITSITFTMGSSFVANSSFYLYGIKNS